MYETFYGLRENPFQVTPDPHFLYLGERHREALARLIYGVQEKKGFMVITGEVGTGKTTLIHCLLQTFNGNGRTRTAFLFNPLLSSRDFLQYILKDLGLTPQGGTKADYLHTLYEYLLQAYKRQEKVVLIVDEAQGLNPALLEEIRLLSNLETSKSKLLQIILSGQPELEKNLSLRKCRQIRQRVNLWYRLKPLSLQDTKVYIQKRLQIAGAQTLLFTEKAIREIYSRSGGIPRLINILCDNSLLSGYAADQKIVGRKVIRETAQDLQLGPRIPGAWKWIFLAILIIACGLPYLALLENGYVSILLRDSLRLLQALIDMMGNQFHLPL